MCPQFAEAFSEKRAAEQAALDAERQGEPAASAPGLEWGSGPTSS